MEREFATPDVREAVLFAVAHVTPEETCQLLEKCALFHPSVMAVRNMVKKTGDVVEKQVERLNQLIQDEDEVPSQTRVLVASLDGTNVRRPVRASSG